MGVIQNTVNTALTTTAVASGLADKNMESFAKDTQKQAKSNVMAAADENRNITREAERGKELADYYNKELKGISEYKDLLKETKKSHPDLADNDRYKSEVKSANKQLKQHKKEAYDAQIMADSIQSLSRQSSVILEQSNRINQDIAILNSRGIIGKLKARNKANENTKDIQDISDAYKDLYKKETK